MTPAAVDRPPPAVRTRWLLGCGVVAATGMVLRWGHVPKPVLDPFYTGWPAPLALALITALAMKHSARAWGFAASLAGALMLTGLPLWWVWSCHELWHGPYVFARLLPYADAAEYFRYAAALFQGTPVANSVFDRPLYPGFLASLLALTGFDFKSTLVLSALFNGLCLWHAARVVARFSGMVGAVTCLVLLHFIYRVTAGTMMTEQLGLALGMLGSAELLGGWLNRNLRTAALGLFWLALALMTRPAAMFVLPGVACLLVFDHWRSRTWSARLSLSFCVALALVAAWGFNKGLRSVMFAGEPPQNVWFDTHAHTHGLESWHVSLKVVGGDWKAARDASLQKIRTDPYCLVTATQRAFHHTLAEGQFWRINGMGSGAPLLACLAVCGLLFRGFTAGTRRWWWLNTAVWLGFAGSIPFASLQVTGFRIYAATAPAQMLLVCHAAWQIFEGLRLVLLRLASPLAWTAVALGIGGAAAGLEWFLQQQGVWHGVGGGVVLATLLAVGRRRLLPEGGALPAAEERPCAPCPTMPVWSQALLLACVVLAPVAGFGVGRLGWWPARLSQSLLVTEALPSLIPSGAQVHFAKTLEPTRAPFISEHACTENSQRRSDLPRATVVLSIPGEFSIGPCGRAAICAFAGTPGADFRPRTLHYAGTWEGRELYLDQSLQDTARIIPLAPSHP